MEEALNELLVALAEEKKKTVESLAGAMFYAFGDLLGTAHSLLFMATKSGDFSVKHGVGKGIDELGSKLRISAEFKHTLFHAAIKNNVDVSISDVSKLREAALPGNYKTVLPQVSDFADCQSPRNGIGVLRLGNGKRSDFGRVAGH